jgi:hypothetical protein
LRKIWRKCEKNLTEIGANKLKLDLGLVVMNIFTTKRWQIWTFHLLKCVRFVFCTAFRHISTLPLAPLSKIRTYQFLKMRPIGEFQEKGQFFLIRFPPFYLQLNSSLLNLRFFAYFIGTYQNWYITGCILVAFKTNKEMQKKYLFWFFNHY